MRIRSRKDNREGYTVDRVLGMNVVIWDKEDGVDIVPDSEIVVHEDDSMIAAMCDIYCNFKREEE